MGGNYKSQDHSVLAHSLDKWCKDGLAKNLESNSNMLENLYKRSLNCYFKTGNWSKIPPPKKINFRIIDCKINVKTKSFSREKSIESSRPIVNILT